MRNVINWFEIPSVNFDRAVGFYSTILNAEIPIGEFMGTPHGFLVDDAGESRGAIIHSSDALPGTTGPLIYLHAGAALPTVLERVQQSGGAVLMPTTSLGEQGTMAIIRDTEGNRVALHMP